MMKPLEQWICDTCGELIEKPSDGYLEWLSEGDDFRVSEFRIVHHGPRSPLRTAVRGDGHCYKHDRAPGRQDSALDEMVGHRGMVDMLTYLDPGVVSDPEGTRGSCVADLRNWTETFRRLFLPYYEEARRYFVDAQRDEFFAGTSEEYPYQEETLRALIEKYGPDSE